MKLTALAVVILALGIVVGFALAGGSSGGPASAVPQCPGPSSQCATPTPAPPQQREDQIVLFASNVSIVTNVPGQYETLAGSLPPLLALDPGDYPSGASFQFEATWRQASGTIACLRLFDVTTNTPVAGSEICSSAVGGTLVRPRSSPITLALSEHEYITQGKCGLTAPVCGSPSIGIGRVIVEWTEKARP